MYRETEAWLQVPGAAGEPATVYHVHGAVTVNVETHTDTHDEYCLDSRSAYQVPANRRHLIEITCSRIDVHRGAQITLDAVPAQPTQPTQEKTTDHEHSKRFNQPDRQGQVSPGRCTKWCCASED